MSNKPRYRPRAVLVHKIFHIALSDQHLLRKTAAGEIVEMSHRLAAMSFAPYQELEADAQGERMSIEAGYDPKAAAALFTRMLKQMHEPPRVPATTPAGELTQAAGDAFGSFFRTHPPSEERARRLNEMAAQHRVGRSLGRPQDIVRAYTAQEVCVAASLEGKAIAHGDACFPDIAVTLHLLNAKRGVPWIFEQ